MSGGNTLSINASTWATATSYFIKSIDVVASGACNLILHDKAGNEIFRATSAAAGTVNYVVNKYVEGIIVNTWTNMTRATIHI